MEEETGLKEEVHAGEDKNKNIEIFSKTVRAGKRTYFFDVKATKKDDYYLTITESKKKTGKEGKYFYEKHKIFLYKEDFEKFLEGLNESVGYIGTDVEDPNRFDLQPQENTIGVDASGSQQEYSNIEFDDLGNR